jgi:hypothetical protein
LAIVEKVGSVFLESGNRDVLVRKPGKRSTFFFFFPRPVLFKCLRARRAFASNLNLVPLLLDWCFQDLMVSFGPLFDCEGESCDGPHERFDFHSEVSKKKIIIIISQTYQLHKSTARSQLLVIIHILKFRVDSVKNQ